MSVGPVPASAASSLIEGYSDEFLSLASSFAETVAQADLRGVDLTASQHHLIRFQEGLASLGVVIDELCRREPPPPAAVDPAAVDPAAAAPVTFQALPGLGDEPAWETRASAAGPVDVVPPANEGHEEIEARVVEAYSFLVDPEAPDQPAESTDHAAVVDQNAPVHFDRRPAPGLARALESLSPNVGSAANQASATSGDAEEYDAPVNPSLKGSNATMPVRSVFQFLERVRKSGVMRVALADEVVTFEFEGGWVHSCRTNNQAKGDRLGDLLAGVCDQKELQALLENAVVMNNLQVGELIVRSGLASNGQVLDALEAQARRRFQRVCDSVAATYEFIEGVAKASDGRVRIAPMELAFQKRR